MAFAQQDCSSKLSRALLRRAAPEPQNYEIGNLITHRKEDGANTATQTWSSPARIIGFENKVVWAIHEGVPVALSLDKIRPCDQAEALAYYYVHEGKHTRFNEPREELQQKYIDLSKPTGKKRKGPLPAQSPGQSSGLTDRQRQKQRKEQETAPLMDEDLEADEMDETAPMYTDAVETRAGERS